jgi:hypothetical protein
MAKVQELSFKISSENLNNLINTLRDLSGIDKKSMFKIDSKDTLIYSKVGEGNSINAFKSFIYTTKDLFEVDDFQESINYITNDNKEMYRKLQILNSFGQDVTGKIYFDKLGDDYYAERISMKAGPKLKLNFGGGDPNALNSKISVSVIKQTMDVDNSNFNFNLKSEDFTNIKRLATADAENDVFYLNTTEKEGKHYVSIGESSWDLTLSEIEYDRSITMSFPKKYFKCITISGDSSKIYIFDNMLMVSTGDSDMLISTEISV